MSCVRPDRMDLYLEGELRGAERREVEGHLAACPACLRILEDRRVLAQAFSSLPPIDIPEGFAAAILAKLPAERRPASGWLAALATGIALLLVGLVGYHVIAGKSVAEVLVSMGRSLVGFISLAVPFVAKLLKLVPVFIALARDLGTTLLRGLGFVSSLLRPEVVGLILALGLGLSLLLVFGVKKIVSLGEKS